MNKDFLIDFIRWILVLPVVLLVHVVAYFVYLWFGDDVNISFFKYVEIVMAFAFSAGLSIIAGSLTAPHHKKIVSIVLCAVSCTLMVVGLCMMVFKYDEYGMLSILGNIASIIGSICGAYIINKELIE